LGGHRPTSPVQPPEECYDPQFNQTVQQLDANSYMASNPNPPPPPVPKTEEDFDQDEDDREAADYQQSYDDNDDDDDLSESYAPKWTDFSQVDENMNHRNDPNDPHADQQLNVTQRQGEDGGDSSDEEDDFNPRAIDKKNHAHPHHVQHQGLESAREVDDSELQHKESETGENGETVDHVHVLNAADAVERHKEEEEKVNELMSSEASGLGGVGGMVQDGTKKGDTPVAVNEHEQADWNPF